ncbi:hypothetical protein GLGCALEP_03165 [Pseudomonas sp. MM221]|nr:hypothetical protein DBADOPDK_03090 [Pseudomonas sp. MM223]CAI3803148.1 hypothetical protein GLGCALEP_03165 [Pseudomonas sp. MM221]
MDTPIGSLLLITSLEKFAASALYGQARALVTERQQEVSAFIDDPATRTLISGLQGRLQDHASEYLNDLLPAAIACISDVEATSLMISTLRESRHAVGIADQAVAAQQFYQLIKSDIARAQQNTQALCTHAAQWLEASDKVTNRLQASIDKLTVELAGDSGKIATTQAAIEKTSREMGQAVSRMLLASQSIGGNTKAVATWVFSLFGAKDEPKSTPPLTKTKPSPAPDTEPEETEKQAPFPVETLGEIASGATDVVDAINSFSKFTDALQDQYQQLYRQKAALSVAIVIKQQGLDHREAIERFNLAASDLNEAWTQLDSSWQQTASNGSTLDDHLLDAGWDRMPDRLDRIKRSLTGTGGHIPRLQRKAALVVLTQGATQ